MYSKEDFLTQMFELFNFGILIKKERNLYIQGQLLLSDWDLLVM